MLVATMSAAMAGDVLLGGIAQGIGKGGREQRAADLGALARGGHARGLRPPVPAADARRRRAQSAPPQGGRVQADGPRGRARRGARQRPQGRRRRLSPTATPSRPRALASPCAILPRATPAATTTRRRSRPPPRPSWPRPHRSRPASATRAITTAPSPTVNCFRPDRRARPRLTRRSRSPISRCPCLNRDRAGH
jgi:hypothetical protein